MNRVKFLRDKLGLTQEQLAERMGVKQATISRYESGRLPRGKELNMLAEALNVRVADLIEAVLAVDLKNELVPVEVILSASLVKVGFSAYRVTSDSVSRVGIKENDVVLVGGTRELLSSLTAGDIVAVEATTDDDEKVWVIRQFLPPNLVTTNRDGTNLSINLDDPTVDCRIVGKVIAN